MNEAAERLRKMQVLSRLRLLERDQQAFRHLHCESEHAARSRDFEQRRSHYQTAHAAAGFNPDTYVWRLSGIEALRLRAQAAGDELQEASFALKEARHLLSRRELEKKVADKANDEARQDFMSEQQRQEQAETLDLQLFRERRP